MVAWGAVAAIALVLWVAGVVAFTAHARRTARTPGTMQSESLARAWAPTLAITVALASTIILVASLLEYARYSELGVVLLPALPVALLVCATLPALSTRGAIAAGVVLLAVFETLFAVIIAWNLVFTVLGQP